jgi:hypothetical protein
MNFTDFKKPYEATKAWLPQAKAVRSGDLLDVRRMAQTSMLDGRLIVWFSMGAASACMLKLLAHLKPMAVYCNTSKDEHPDNLRFRGEIEHWTGIKVTVIGSDKYQTTDEVFEDTQYMSGIGGARCTTELKKIPRLRFAYAEDIHCFGMTVDEQKRIKQFEANNHDMNLAWPLVTAGMTKHDCLKELMMNGIELPAMYQLGFENNNCIGCVKAQSPDYWNRTRKHFPERFRQRAEQSRRLGVKLVKLHGERIFLDELPENETEKLSEDLSCGPQCADARTSNE